MPELKTDFCSLKLGNPTVLASGFLGLSREVLQRVVENGAGAVTVKSITREPREGHPNPTVIGIPGGLMNAVGYSNPGLRESKKEFSDLSTILAPVFGSVVAGDAEGFAALVRDLEELDFAAIELPLSCPHTPGFGTLAGQSTPEATEEIVCACRKETRKPLIVKVSPNVQALGEIAKAAEKAGADAISAVNSLGPGMVIDINSASPVLSFKVGGLSGQPLHPIAVRCVYDVFEAVKIPIIGIGGASTGKEAIELLQAGASLVGVGTGVYLRGMDVFKNICMELIDWMEVHDFKKVKELIGIAHE